MLDVLYDILFIGIPCFIAGMLFMFAIFAQAKNEQDDKRKDTRKKRIRYILYLTDIVIKKRQQENKIDVD
jgi:hypothetical protein